MTTRITGLYSGLDVDALVEAGSSYYKNKLDKAKQDKQVMQWKQDQYQSIESDVTDFYNKYLDITSADSLMSSSNWNTKKFTSSNDSAVTATANNDAVLDNYSVSVSKLASAATTTLSASTDYSNGLEITVSGGTPIDISAADISNATASASTDADKQKAIASLINSKISSSGATASYSQISGGITISTTALGGNTSLKVTDDTTSKNSLLKDSSGNTVNSVSGTYLNATITNSEGNIYTIDDSKALTSNSTTVDNTTFAFNAVTTSSSESTKYLTSSSVENLLGNHIKSIDTSISGQTTYTLDDAGTKVTIKNTGEVSITDKNGTAITNSVELTNSDGSTTTLNTDGTVTTKSKNDSAVTLKGTNDVSNLEDSIESFVNDYNTLITTINSKYYEAYDSDYKPLTDDEEADMSSDQISKWNTQAQTGLLHNDNYLDSLASGLKNAMSSFMNGFSIESFGISAVNDYTTKNGTYSVDSSKLTSALQDPDKYNAIKSLLLNGSDTITSTSTTCANSSGLLVKLKTTMNAQVVNVDSIFSQEFGNDDHPVTSTTNEYYTELKDQDDLISKYQDEYSDKEDALYLKYSNLETQMAQLQSSSSIFSSSSNS